jgi:hypothetical protein
MNWRDGKPGEADVKRASNAGLGMGRQDVKQGTHELSRSKKPAIIRISESNGTLHRYAGQPQRNSSRKKLLVSERALSVQFQALRAVFFSAFAAFSPSL